MKKMIKKIIASMAAMIIFAGSLAAQSGVKIQFEAKDIYNKNVTDAVFKDAEVTMINIWGTFCGPCISEMPDLGILNKNYESKGLQIIGIVIDSVNRKGRPDVKTIEAAKTIVEKTGADYLHIVPDKKLQNGIIQEVVFIPTTFFVDKNGNQISEIYTGSRSFEEWQEIIDSILK